MTPEGEESVVQQPDDQGQGQHWYPARQRRLPVRYGIDEYTDMALLGGIQTEDLRVLKKLYGVGFLRSGKRQLIQSSSH